ncbi:MAG: Vi polysaccharide biosynthesis protein VipA/TviB [Candidatus Marinimicrobia bacterium]|nr:Vi polysaccharide biosynthesis protein VipA/TviB [Candidatus Neomarinimicrobiota bacterium]|tara:strand:+ start:2580 stop:3851 length:1272 start_codon:yes stop_codon:yes gene_type:complete
MENKYSDISLAVIGLGYVGLPLYVELAKKFKTLGYDINQQRINDLESFKDLSGEVGEEELKLLSQQKKLDISCNSESLRAVDVYIITVPTPVDEDNIPDLNPLFNAIEIVGENLKKGNVVVLESTVYPGVTEDICARRLEKYSGLKFNKDFFMGYSPERINPGDKKHHITKVIKLVSGSNQKTLDLLSYLYGEIIEAGIFEVKSIKVAEAAKVIENAQRDVNIAFVNELSMLFDNLDINTTEVLEAASTKWNFLNFSPGLVGGHCIGVDPYYLTYKAKEVGYNPEVINAGRRINDSMSKFIAKKFHKILIDEGCLIKEKKQLILGITFKENCSDIRNSKVIDLYRELENLGCNVDIFDPHADPDLVKNEYQIEIFTKEDELEWKDYEGILCAVKHDSFLSLDLNRDNVIFDLKSYLPFSTHKI